MKKYNKILSWFMNYAIILILLLLIVFFSISSDNFFKLSTMFTILRQVAITGIISIGMAFVILTGGIDLSVGSIAGVSSVTAAMLMLIHINPFLACSYTLLIALFYGIVNGVLISKINMPPLIATLGMMTSLRGVAFLITGGLPVFGFNPNFGNFALGTFLKIPLPVILLFIIFLLSLIFLNHTTIGRYIFSIGGNAESSRLSGINVDGILY
jgi:ribose/xylose/arabinose/galactoside ABC-type transport system permease subunit